jgi:diacylglycerol kinase (ATP)
MKDTPGNSKKPPSRNFIGLGYAFRGIHRSILTQVNLRIHLIAATLAFCLGFWLKISYFEWIAVVIVSATVIAAEMINTAIEGLTDLISPEYQNKAGFVKDIAAGAVLVLAIAAALTGAMIFLPKLADLLLSN